MTLNTRRFVSPRVIGDKRRVDLYVVGEAPGEEEERQGLTFVGKSGQLLDGALRDAGISSARLFNVVPFRPEGNRTPTREEVEEYKEYLVNDIRTTRPRVILCTGRTAASALVGDIGPLGRAKERVYSFEGIPVYLTWHPAFVLRSGGTNSIRYRELVSDICRCKQVFSEEAKKVFPEIIEVDMFESDKISYYLDEVFREDDEVGLDYEGSGDYPLSEDFFVTVTGIYSPSTNKCLMIKFYSRFRRPESMKIPKKTSRAIADFLSRKTPVVYNLQYEFCVSKRIFDIELSNALDVYAMAKCDGYGPVSLKSLAMRVLPVFDWSEDFEKWVSVGREIVRLSNSNYCGMKKFAESLSVQLANSDEEVSEFLRKARESSESVRKREFLEKVETIHSINVNYGLGDGESVEVIRGLISSKKEDRAYGEVPHEILVPYCARDCYYTFEVMKAIGIKKEHDIYFKQSVLSCYIYSSGIAWDIEKSFEVSLLYDEICRKNLRLLLTQDKFLSVLKESDKDLTREKLETRPEEELLSYFNPASTSKKSREILSKVLFSARVKLAMAIYPIYEESAVKPKEELKSKYPNLYRMFEDVISSDRKLERINYFVENLRRIFEAKKATKAEIELLREKFSYVLDSMSSEAIEHVYSVMTTIMGVNVDDESTWTDEFRALFHFRMYKKSLKCKTAFIEGKVGRGSVALVRRDEIEKVTPVIKCWYEEAGEEITSSGEYRGLQIGEWSPNAANTKRWKSPVHTVPWDSELMMLRVSRYRDGIRIHTDYSQMEVRVLAVAAEEESLIQAFRDGVDIHRFVASKVFGKPQEQIKDFERRFAKAVTFSILYGQSVNGLAVEHLKGNYALAEQMFSTLFESFPGIKRFIRNCHEQALRNGIVVTLFGDYIKIDMPDEVSYLSDEQIEEILDGNLYKSKSLSGLDNEVKKKISAALRAAQNYPIQSAASNLSALSAYNSFLEMRKRGVSACIDCFTHDSIDYDQRISDIFVVVPLLSRELDDYPARTYGVPVKSEMEIGVNGYEMLEVELIDTDEKSFLELHYKGKDSSVSLLKDLAERNGIRVEVEEDKRVVEKKSLSELFLGRRGLNTSFGEAMTLSSGRIKLWRS